MTREEAIKVVKSATVYTPKEIEALETLIPELAESEDERIRKAIICGMNALKGQNMKTFAGIPIDDCLAYLEKQKEQIPYTDFVIKPHKGDDSNPYDMRVSEAQEYAIKRGFGIPFNDGEVYVDERHLTQTIGNILRWADEHPKEQKPAEWSEEDKKLIDDVINSLCCYQNTLSDYQKEIVGEEIRKLKSLKPQSKQEWSEEQPGVKLEKEIDDYIEGCLGGLTGREIASCARYFYELGRQSNQKNENSVS